MQAVILAAGQGTRLGQLTQVIPKPLLRVGGKPILEHTFSQLPNSIDEVVIVVGYLQRQIRQYFGKNFGNRQIKYIKQRERLGTGQALFLCQKILGNEKFLVIMGDDLYLKKDIERCLENDLSLLAKKMEVPKCLGILKVKNGILDEIVESPQLAAKGLVNCGLYVLDKRIFDYSLSPIGNGEYGLPQTMVKMSRDYPIKIERASFWMPINMPQDLEKADRYLKKLIGK